VRTLSDFEKLGLLMFPPSLPDDTAS